MVVKWTFFDAFTNITTMFEVNPNEGGTPPLEKNVTATPTVAPGGLVILSEGNQPVQTIDFSGIILTQTQFTDLVNMFGKLHQIRLTDDLGRQFMILITKFEPKRMRARSSPWKHSYSVTATIIDWP